MRVGRRGDQRPAGSPVGWIQPIAQLSSNSRKTATDTVMRTVSARAMRERSSMPLPSRGRRTMNTPADASATRMMAKASPRKIFMVEQYPTPPASDPARTAAPAPLSSPTRRVVVLLAALAVCGLTARLGLWQLDRAAQKTRLHEQQVERRMLPALDPVEWPRSAAEAEPLHERAVLLRGEWLATGTVYLDNRQMRARPGFYVVTPLRLADGRVVAVQRGWVPRDNQDRLRLPPLRTPDDLQSVRGRLVGAPSKLYDFGDAGQGLIRQNLDLDAHGRALGLRLEPWSVQQTDPVGADDTPLLRDWPEPAVDVSKHHGYAAQWFALSALCAGLYVWFQLLRPQLRRRRNEPAAGRR